MINENHLTMQHIPVLSISAHSIVYTGGIVSCKHPL